MGAANQKKGTKLRKPIFARFDMRHNFETGSLNTQWERFKSGEDKWDGYGGLMVDGKQLVPGDSRFGKGGSKSGSQTGPTGSRSGSGERSADCSMIDDVPDWLIFAIIGAAVLVVISIIICCACKKRRRRRQSVRRPDVEMGPGVPMRHPLTRHRMRSKSQGTVWDPLTRSYKSFRSG